MHDPYKSKSNDMVINRPKTGRYVNPYTDFGFKWLFGTEVNKDLLIDFLNSLLTLDSPIKDITYKNVEKLGDTIEDRRAVFDVYCESDNGEQFIVEMQREIQEFFVDRSIFYASFPIRDQAMKGEMWDFKLTAVYTVGILDFSFDDSEEYRHEVKLVDTTTEKVFYDKLTFVYLEMPKFKKDITECHTFLDKWMFVLKNMTRLLERPVELQNRIFKKLFDTAEVANFTDVQRAQYEESLKVYRDWNNVLNTAIKNSKKEGIIEGEAKGKAEGMAEGMRKAARNMKKLGMPTEQISLATGLSAAEIETLNQND